MKCGIEIILKGQGSGAVIRLARGVIRSPRLHLAWLKLNLTSLGLFDIAWTGERYFPITNNKRDKNGGQARANRAPCIFRTIVSLEWWGGVLFPTRYTWQFRTPVLTLCASDSFSKLFEPNVSQLNSAGTLLSLEGYSWNVFSYLLSYHVVVLLYEASGYESDEE